jgi:hypothetical protein
MSFFAHTQLLVILLLLTACSSVKTYESVANKTCGPNFCSEVEVKNHLGKILVTNAKDKNAKLNSLKLNAYCNFPKRKLLRPKHVGSVANASEPIELVKREGFWEFSTSQIHDGCRFTVSVTFKKIEEKFRFVALGKAALGGKIDTNL